MESVPSVGIYTDKSFLLDVIISTSNGIISCRSVDVAFWGGFEVFIASPTHPTRILISGDKRMWARNTGFAFFPFGCSSEDKAPSFKLVNIHRQQYDSDSYYFSIYSSETGKWKLSSEVCHCNYPLERRCEAVFANGKFNWLTERDWIIICFDAEEERSDLIQLPAPHHEVEDRSGQCLGESQGLLHYVLASDLEARVWVLQLDNKWSVKYHVNLYDVAREAYSRRPIPSDWEEFLTLVDVKDLPKLVRFGNDTLAVLLEYFSALISYSLRTGECRFSKDGGIQYDFVDFPALIPYSFSLAARKAFEELIKRPNAPFALVNDRTLLGRVNWSLKRKRGYNCPCNHRR